MRTTSGAVGQSVFPVEMLNGNVRVDVVELFIINPTELFVRI